MTVLGLQDSTHVGNSCDAYGQIVLYSRSVAGTSRSTRYICILDELGFGPDGLQVFTYWLCYLYCRCTR